MNTACLIKIYVFAASSPLSYFIYIKLRQLVLYVWSMRAKTKALIKNHRTVVNIEDVKFTYWSWFTSESLEELRFSGSAFGTFPKEIL